MICPCKSQKNYEECCKIYHFQENAPDALTLMRSRYSAYALALADYVMRTTHPDHSDFQKKSWQWREEILHFSQETEFIDLEIIAFEPQKLFAFVTFTASLKQKGRDTAFTEKSFFELKDGIWLYKNGEFL